MLATRVGSRVTTGEKNGGGGRNEAMGRRK